MAPTLLQVYQAPLRALIETLRPFLDLLLPLFFVGFFVAALVAMVYHRNARIRRGFVAGLLVLFVLANVFGTAVLPLMHWHKFSNTQEQKQTIYEIRIVDAHGKELHYDHRATLSVDGVTIFIMQRELVEDRPRSEKVERARFLLQRGREYREQVESRSPIHYLRFPPHGMDNIWTPARLDGYGEFIGIRVYRIDVMTSENGLEIESVSETMVMEYMDNDQSKSTMSVKPLRSVPQLSHT